MRYILGLFTMAVFLVLAVFVHVPAFSQDGAVLSLDAPEEKKAEPLSPPVETLPPAPSVTDALEGGMSSEIYKRLSPESQKQVVEESNQVYEYCGQRQLFSSFHDCQCVAAKFFDARLLNPDPEMNIINMGDRVAKDCPNIPGVAGHALNECLGAYGFLLKTGLNEFCECYAQTYAKMYQKDPRATFPNMGSVGSRAILACDAEGLPSPLNPDR